MRLASPCSMHPSNSTMQISVTMTQRTGTPVLLAKPKHNGGRARDPQTNQSTTAKNTHKRRLTKVVHEPRIGKGPQTNQTTTTKDRGNGLLTKIVHEPQTGKGPQTH